MAKSLKTKGLDELAAVQDRTARQFALKRISRADRDFIMDHLNLVEARIVSMEEKSPDLDREDSFG